jgi:endonuclease YncB( thermonuclease family)
MAIPAPIESGGQRVHVRSHGIDVPELDQPFGPEARVIVLRPVLDRPVTVYPAGHSYNRLVADLVLADGTGAGPDVRAALVDAGAAWVEPRSPNRSNGAGAPSHGTAAAYRSLGRSLRDPALAVATRAWAVVAALTALPRPQGLSRARALCGDQGPMLP